MRLYLRRAALALLALFSLTGILIIQSITSFQRHDMNVKMQMINSDDSGNNKNERRTYDNKRPKVPQHEELHPKSVGNGKYDKSSSGIKSQDHNPRFGKVGKTRRRKDADLLKLAHLLPKDSNLVDNFCSSPITVAQHFKQRYGQTMPKNDIWEKFYAQIGSCDLYRPNSDIVEELLRAVATMPIVKIANMDGGTQVKFVITYENGRQSLFKPMRFSRDFETHPNQFYFTDFERHNAEIAAFHLDRLLGFRRAVPTIGRVVNMTKEFLPNADKALARTFFHSPAKNLCFVGKCDYYCDTTHAVCGNPDHVEGSFQAFLPDDEEVPRDHVRSPYKRTYSKRSPDAAWQKDPGYCNWKVKYTPPYSNGRALLDLVDLYILDFLMGNQDRHHYETLTVFDERSSFLHLDNGRAFGKTLEDDLDIVAPLAQCCVVRPSTLKRLLSFYNESSDGDESLGAALRRSLQADPVSPVLAPAHFDAIDRRLEIVLRLVKRCVDEAAGNVERILVNEFYNPDAPLKIDEDDDEDD